MVPFCGVTGNTLVLGMEDITRTWSKLSLSNREGKNVVLRFKKHSQEFVLAAKFLTKRFLKIDAVARTFNPPWRSTKGFHIRDVGNKNCSYFFFFFN